MPIRFNCVNPACGREVRAPDGSEGKKSKCPHCGQVQVIPAAAPEGASPFAADEAPAQSGAGRRKRGRKLIKPRQKKTYARESYDAGKYVKMGLVAAALAGVAVAVIYGPKLLTSKQEGTERRDPINPVGTYLDAVFGAKHMAEGTVSMNNLRLVRDGLEKYHAAFGEYPYELKDLVEEGMVPQAALRAPDRDKQAYAYVPNQDKDMLPEGKDNVIVYEETPIHADRCNVLRLDGRIEKLTPAELEKTLEQTRLRIEGQ